MEKRGFSDSEMWDITRMFGTKNCVVNKCGGVWVSPEKVEGPALRGNTVRYVINKQANGEVFVRRAVWNSIPYYGAPPKVFPYVIHRDSAANDYKGFKSAREAAEWLFWYGVRLQNRSAAKKSKRA